MSEIRKSILQVLQWTSANHNISLKKDHGPLWATALRNLPDKEIMAGLDLMIQERAINWPPSTGEFIDFCKKANYRKRNLEKVQKLIEHQSDVCSKPLSREEASRLFHHLSLLASKLEPTESAGQPIQDKIANIHEYGDPNGCGEYILCDGHVDKADFQIMLHSRFNLNPDLSHIVHGYQKMKDIHISKNNGDAIQSFTASVFCTRNEKGAFPVTFYHVQ